MADRDRALEDYKAGLSYKEIADKHNVSESTVKSWASRHWNNDKKIQAARRKAKKSQLKGNKSRNQKSEKKTQKDAPKPRGAPIGNKNAAGNNGGAPKGSKNALKHGGYSVVSWNELSDEERAMAESMEDTDTEDNLHEEVVLYTIRERRILRAINNMKEVTLKGNVEISTNVSVHKKGSGADTRVVESTTTTNLERAEIAVLRLERELTSVQKAKARTLQTLDEVRRANGKDDDTWLEEFVAAIEAEDESEAEDEVSPEE
jgi:uncharacterized protein YjcR